MAQKVEADLQDYFGSKLILICALGFAWVFVSPALASDTVTTAVWQWSVPAPTIPGRRAFLWIAPECKHVRGIVVACHNMLEQPLFERPAFRAACAENDLAIVMIYSGHDSAPDDGKNPNHPARSSLDIFLNPNYSKGSENPKAAGEDLQKVLDALALESGYAELSLAPLMPVGHSSAGSFVWHLYRWNPDRIFAMMPFKTGMKDDGPSGIPIFNVESEWFDYGHDTSDVSNTPSAIANQRSIRVKNANELFGFYVDIGAGHCDVSDDSIKFVSLFLKKAVAARIPQDTPAGQAVKLKSIDLRSGWLIAPADLGKAGVKPVVYGDWKGDPKQAFWYLDSELASAVQDHLTAQYAKKPQQMNFVKDDGSVPTSGGMFSFSPKFIDDQGTFKVEARYIDQLHNTDVYPAGTTFENSGDPILYRVNSGALRQVGPDTFRIVPHGGPLVPQGNPWEPTVVAYTLGNDQFRPTERPGHVNISIINNGGADQTITFPPIANHDLSDSTAIELNAIASSGLPVQYFVVSGPVHLGEDGHSLEAVALPPRAKTPARVLVAAFQWGRLTGSKLKSAGPVFQQFWMVKPGETAPSTKPIENLLTISVPTSVAPPAAKRAAVAQQNQPAAGPADLITRGQLIADFRPDATATTTAWINHADGPNSLGELKRVDGHPLSVQSIDGPAGNKIDAVSFDGDLGGVLLSAKSIPQEMTGHGSATVEAWVRVPVIQDDATVAAYGVRVQGQQRQFLFGAHKPLSGFFADVDNWGSFTPDADHWHFVVWVYHGDDQKMDVFVDGARVTSQDVALDTQPSPLSLGAGNGETDHTVYNFDPLQGMIASVRIETGELSPDDVKHNFNSGLGSTPGAKSAADAVPTPLATAQPATIAQSAGSESAPQTPPGDPTRYDVVWNSPSKNATDSMPIGNGDIGLNVWVEPSGDLVFYIAKTDAVSENGEFLKLGRVRVKFDPPLPTQAFEQHLRLRDGVIEIAAGSGKTLRIWVDANRPEIHVDAAAGDPVSMRASVELWRNVARIIDVNHDEGFGGQSFGLRELRGGPSVTIDPDTVLSAGPNSVVWLHNDTRSIYPTVLKLEHLESLIDKYPDPILNRNFGCLMRGTGLTPEGDLELRSTAPAKEQHLSITCLTEQTPTVDAWRANIQKIADSDDEISPLASWAAHSAWWHAFWDRSWIDIDGTGSATKVASGYALQRWMMACDARGPLPVKYNGGLFTVGRTYVDPADKTKTIEYPDFRAWGACYWFQNTRHLYWPLIPSGDDDLLQPWFDMYVHDLPLVEDKSRIYWHHEGAAFQETIYFFGLAAPSDFQWGNKTNELKNTWIRWYWSGGIEMTAMMLSRYQFTQDAEFARKTLLPFAQSITTFYNEHWKRDEIGKIRFDPAQSLETWQHGVVNPLPEIAGLRYVLPQLLALPVDLTTDSQRQMWTKLLADLPAVPIGPGKDSQPVLLPAEKFQKPNNVENTELYAVYPYRLYGVGLPDLELARRTFAQRRFPGPKCWSQDPIDAAFLGLTDEAQKDVTANLTNGGARFPAFWKPEHDWIPDFDNGGAGMQALQWMLMQCDGKRIQLLPAWPANWNADFKLRAPMQTTVEASVRDGKIIKLTVTPESRRSDVILPDATATPAAAG